jgi:cytochrome c5
MATRTNRLGMTLAAVACAAVLLAGCGASGSGSASSADGATLVSQVCSKCHPVSRVDGAKKDRSGWTATVDRMVTHGLQVSDAQKTAIVDYLTKRDGGQ